MGDALRKRRVQRGEDELEEPLLGQASSSTGDHGPDSGSTALVPRSINRIDWEQLWRVLCSGCRASWHSVLATLSSCFGPLLPQALRPVRLSATQEARWRDLRARVEDSFDAGNREHIAELQRLWGFAFPGAPWQGLQAERWTDMGWQRDDPSSDFRGAGLIALQNLLYLAQARPCCLEEPALFARLLGKSEGERAQWEYPFAVAGVNLTFMLQELLGLRERRLGALARPDQAPPASAPARGFLYLLAGCDCAFEAVYCLAFEALDAEWLAMRASYMDFPAVMQRVERSLNRALTAQPASLGELRRLLA